MSALFAIDLIAIQLFKIYPNLPSHMITAVIIICPTIGYIDQFKKLINTKNSRVFNLPSALILLTANFIRFLYWIYEPFIPYLLGQSVAVFSIQLVMGIWSYNYIQLPKSQIQTTYRHMSPKFSKIMNVFEASTSAEFALSLFAYASIICIAYIILCLTLSIQRANSIIILLSTIIETTVSFPQFKKIVFDRDINGISTVLLIQYMVGDMLKIVMFLASHAQWAFLFGALLQTSIDTTNFIVYTIISKSGIQKQIRDDEQRLLGDTSAL